MDIKDVEARLGEIELYADDYERAHSLEDKLWEDVLTTLAERDGCEIAREALKSRDIEFPRYSA